MIFVGWHTFSRKLRSCTPFIHHVILAVGFDPIAWHSMSYVRSADNGWLFNRISTDSGRTGKFNRYLLNIWLASKRRIWTICCRSLTIRIFEQRNQNYYHFNGHLLLTFTALQYEKMEEKKMKCNPIRFVYYKVTNDRILNTIMIS